jgi:hypothetical protein
MKQNIKIAVLAIGLWAVFHAHLFAQAPVVSNVNALQRQDGSKIIDVYYDLAHNNPCEIFLSISTNGGISYDLQPQRANLSGAVGSNVRPGTNRHIIWNAGAESTSLNGAQYRVKIFASSPFGGDNTLQYIPAGSFYNNGSLINLSAYYVDKYEVSQGSFEAVMRYNPAHGQGESPDHPVYNTTWFMAIEYCNRRSIQEGLNPCYSYADFGSDPDLWVHDWDSENQNHLEITCDWAANGYRLLTEMEWLYAAKGGADSNNYSYSGSNTLGNVAWYGANSHLLPPTHPDHCVHPGGMKAANELGLYDMTGNLYEWCWDIYGNLPYGEQTDPHGASGGTSRIIKGGGWKSDSYGCQIHIRCIGVPLHTGDGDFGFRIGRTAL